MDQTNENESSLKRSLRRSTLAAKHEKATKVKLESPKPNLANKPNNLTVSFNIR